MARCSTVKLTAAQLLFITWTHLYEVSTWACADWQNTTSKIFLILKNRNYTRLSQ